MGLFDLGIDPETQAAIGQYAALPRQPAKKSGLADILKSVLGGAMDGVATHYGAPPGFALSREAKRQENALMQKLFAEQQQRQQAFEDARRGHVMDRQADLSNPAPTDYARALQEQGLTPGTPQFQAAMEHYNTSRADPWVTTTLPGNRFYSGPNSGLPAALGGVAGGLQEGQTATNPQTGEKIQFRKGAWVPMGGGGGNATGGFRSGIIPGVRP